MRRVVRPSLALRTAADKDETKGDSSSTWRERVLVIMESIVVSLVILALVIVTVVAKLSATGDLLILAAFALETAVRAWAMGIKLYLIDPFCGLDVTLVLVDVVVTIAASGGTNVSGARLARALKFCKFLREFLPSQSCDAHHRRTLTLVYMLLQAS
jgi:hypothetical protein